MKLILLKVRSYFRRPLPVGMTEFEKWSDRIIALSGEYADRDSMKYALATMIMHLKPTEAFVPDNYFVSSLRKTAANQVAGQVFQDIKTKQQEAQAAAQKQAAADTATSEVATSVEKESH